MTEPSKIETTYADLRPTDLVIDKAGKAWPIKELDESSGKVWFWLCDPVSKMKAHFIGKPSLDPVTVSRVPSHTDEAAKLEADFPKSGSPVSTTESTTSSVETGATGSTGTDSTTLTVGVEADYPISDEDAEWVKEVTGDDPREKSPADLMAEAVAATGWTEESIEVGVAAIKEVLGGTVEAEVTAQEVDAAAAATEDAPVILPPFDSMTPLERRSHLYLLHGIYATDVRSNDELVEMHNAAGSVQSKTVPHVHEATA